MLAICSLRLTEEGLIDLDELRPGQPFTLRQLLQHRARVPEYGKLQAYHDAVSRSDPPWSRARLLEEVQSDRLDFEPGTGWAYSNLGYLFVRDAIEEVTGLNLATALKLDSLGEIVAWRSDSSTNRRPRVLSSALRRNAESSLAGASVAPFGLPRLCCLRRMARRRSSKTALSRSTTKSKSRFSNLSQAELREGV